jgi:hypothetical protein
MSHIPEPCFQCGNPDTMPCEPDCPGDLVMDFVMDALSALCAVHGDHDIVDNGSYTNPESAVEHLACTRCPWELNHVLY